MAWIKHFQFNSFMENCYIIWDESLDGVIIDPGFVTEEEKAKLYAFIGKENIHLCGILLTHGHTDHIFGAAQVQRDFDVAAYMHPDDLPILGGGGIPVQFFGGKTPDTRFMINSIHDGDVLGTDSLRFKVIHTPGHTPGGVCYHCEEEMVIFTGDTLFAGTIGRTDLQGGDYDRLIVSVMDKVMGLDTDTDILPGHGASSSIGWERTHNPMLEPFNEEEAPLDEDVEGIELHFNG